MASDLPPEILRLILGKLNLQERIKLRLVCRKWRAVIESLKVDQLSIVDLKFSSRQNWRSFELNTGDYENLLYYQDSPLIPFGELFTNLVWSFGKKKKKLHSLLFNPRNPMFSRVKRLFVCLRAIDGFSFEEYINCQFEQLEELSCYSLSFFSQTCLRLANLRALSMQAVQVSEQKRIELDLPKLEQFTTFSKIQFFRFVHPQSLLRLIAFEDHESILQFTNLQVLRCMRYRNEAAIFANLSQLKELHYENLNQIDFIDLDAIHRTKQNLGRSDLKMLVLGLDFKDYRRLNLSAKRIATAMNEFIADNYANLAPLLILSVFMNAHYNKLASSFDQRILSDFKLKFPNLRSLHVTSIESNVHLFFRFLYDYPNLCRLQLREAFDALTDYQTCYDLLPAYCRWLRELDISSALGLRSGPWSPANTIEPSFLLKFKYLQNFTTNLALTGTISLSMWKALKHLKSQHLVGKLQVRKTKSGLFTHYELRFSDPSRKSIILSYNLLIKFFS